jgi:hypothetical protein
VSGGNAYGGAVSLYIGAYSSVFSVIGDAVAAVGDTLVQNVSVSMDASRFESCAATRETIGAGSSGANVYGGSFSFHVGSYAWSQTVSSGSRSNSMCGSTTVRFVRVRVQNAFSSNVRASTETIGGAADGANSYGGSLSLVHVGAYTWSLSTGASSGSSSTSGATAASEVSIHVSVSACYNCSATSTTSGGNSRGASSYGGSMSLMHVGAYTWSRSLGASTSSACGATNASGLDVRIQNASSFNVRASTATNAGTSFGANSYGGSLSVLHVGAYSWSIISAVSRDSTSTCGFTTASGVSVHVSGSPCYNCGSLSTNSAGPSFGANSYGGSMSLMHVGAYSWSRSFDSFSSSSSVCEATTASKVSVHVSGSVCFNCKSWSSTSAGFSNGANSYGGSMSVAHVGAYSWSWSSGFSSNSSSTCDSTAASQVLVHISGSACSNCSSLSNTGEFPSNGANSYGGSISIMHVGAYSWSFCRDRFSITKSTCGKTAVSEGLLEISGSKCFDCGSLSSSTLQSLGANSYGGSMSLMHVGAYSWSRSFDSFSSSSSACEATTASKVSVHVSGSVCFNCKSVSSSRGGSNGANSYGGLMSVAHVGAYSWSFSHDSSSSTNEATAASEISVNISGSACSNCSALSSTRAGASAGANAYGGMISMMHVGSYSWSLSLSGNSSSTSRMTAASGVSVHVHGLTCSSCSALSTTSGGNAFGANSYGGSISAAVFGGYSLSFASQGSPGFLSSAKVEVTKVNHLTITIKTAIIWDAIAMSGDYSFILSICCRSSY